MLKIPEMPNPFKLAFSSYKMTTLGKLFFGSYVAEAAANAYDNHQAQQRPQRQQRNLSPDQEAWEFYRNILAAITRSNNVHWWQSQARCMKQKYLVALCLKENKAYLVPAMQSSVFPHL